MLNTKIPNIGAVERLAAVIAVMQSQPECLSVLRTTALRAF